MSFTFSPLDDEVPLHTEQIISKKSHATEFDFAKKNAHSVGCMHQLTQWPLGFSLDFSFFHWRKQQKTTYVNIGEMSQERLATPKNILPSKKI